MKKIISILAFSMTFLAFSFGQTEEDYAKTLKEMFKVSGSEETFQTVIRQMIDMFRQQNANVDNEIWDEFERELSKTSINDLVGMLTPVYIKYMTLDDLKAIINFYQTPIGQKFAKSTPLIMEESMQIGQVWGMEIGEELTRKLQEKGY